MKLVTWLTRERTLLRWRWALGQSGVALEYKLSDLWVGAYVRVSGRTVDVWVCVVPCLPVHVCWVRRTA